jgi:hypothetical protein
MKVPFSFWITPRLSADAVTTPAKRTRAAKGIFIWLDIIISVDGSGM